MKSQFLLDPEVIFLNHGSFGACPRPVFDAYWRWQREMVIHSLDPRPYTEILTTDHEYGAMHRTWRSVCRKTGARRKSF